MKLLRAKNKDWIQLGYTLLNRTYHIYYVNDNCELIETYGLWINF